MEEDESLHDMWAALLANASSPKGKYVRPGFIRLLQDMAPDEAALLQIILEASKKAQILKDEFTATRFANLPDLETAKSRMSAQLGALFREITPAFPSLPDEDQSNKTLRFQACLQSLESARLVFDNSPSGSEYWDLTGRGEMFLKACTPP